MEGNRYWQSRSLTSSSSYSQSVHDDAHCVASNEHHQQEHVGTRPSFSRQSLLQERAQVDYDFQQEYVPGRRCVADRSTSLHQTQMQDCRGRPDYNTFNEVSKSSVSSRLIHTDSVEAICNDYKELVRGRTTKPTVAHSEMINSGSGNNEMFMYSDQLHHGSVDSNGRCGTQYECTTSRDIEAIDQRCSQLSTEVQSNEGQLHLEYSNEHDDDLDIGDGSDEEGGVSYADNELGVPQVSLGDASSCNVCGDVVAGFHCGAYVCEACKKFFVRCLKQDTGAKFTCSQNNECIITKDTRTQCPHCRYQKCLSLGMYRPGGPNLSSEIRHIPCKVCGAPSSGFHFGAITCEGCKGFFRRSVKERDSLKYQCSRNGNCNITSKTRNVCKMCRYRQCLRAGMRPEKSRIGRQPNAVKHATFIQVNRMKLEKGLPLEDELYDAYDAIATQDSESSQHMVSTLSHAAGAASSSYHDANDSNAVSAKSHSRTKRTYRKRHGSELQCNDVPFAESNDLYLGVTIKQENVSPPAFDDNSFSFGATDSVQSRSATGVGNDVGCGSNQCGDDSYTCPPSWQSQTVSRHESTASRGTSLSQSPLASARGSAEFGNSVDSTAEPRYRRRSAPGNDEVRGDSSTTDFSDSNDAEALPDSESVIQSMKQAYEELVTIFSRTTSSKSFNEDSSMAEIWESQMTQFMSCAKSTLKFAKKVPGFRFLSVEEQILMVQTCMFPIVAAVLSIAYDPETHKVHWFNFTDEEQSVILKRFDVFCHLMAAMQQLGQAIHELDPDETELAFLCGIHLIDCGSQPVYKELLVDALGEYTKRKGDEVSGVVRQGQILMCLRDLADTNQVHNETIALMLADPQFAHLELPQLFRETFIGMENSQ